MRIFFTVVLTILFHLSLTQAVEARGIPLTYGTEDSLDFIEETTILGPDDKPLALCHYTSKYHVFYLGFWRASNGYVLSDDSCETDTYRSFNEGDFSAAQEWGFISKDLPKAPKMTMNLIASGFAGSGIVALVVLIFLWTVISTARRKAARRAEMGEIPKAAGQILDAMCHAAISDGSVDNSEVKKIIEIAKEMTGETFSADRIRLIIGKASKKPSEGEFRAFGAGLAPDQKELVLQAVFAIIAADGEFTESEHEFFTKMAQALSLTGSTVRRIVQEAEIPS